MKYQHDARSRVFCHCTDHNRKCTLFDTAMMTMIERDGKQVRPIIRLHDYLLLYLLFFYINNLFFQTRIIVVRVRAYGPGVEPAGPVVGAPAKFTVETFSAGKGNVQVAVQDGQGKEIPVSHSFHAVSKNIQFSN